MRPRELTYFHGIKESRNKKGIFLFEACVGLLLGVELVEAKPCDTPTIAGVSLNSENGGVLKDPEMYDIGRKDELPYYDKARYWLLNEFIHPVHVISQNCTLGCSYLYFRIY